MPADRSPEQDRQWKEISSHDALLNQHKEQQACIGILVMSLEKIALAAIKGNEEVVGLLREIRDNTLIGQSPDTESEHAYDRLTKHV